MYGNCSDYTIPGTYNVTDGTVNANGTPHLIKDGGIYVEN